MKSAAAAKQALVERGKGEVDRRFEVHMAWYKEQDSEATSVDGEADEELARLVAEVDEHEFAGALAGIFYV